jgi:hypothetical protein
MWVAMILAIWSAADYFVSFWRSLGDKLLRGQGRLAGADDDNGNGNGNDNDQR